MLKLIVIMDLVPALEKSTIDKAFITKDFGTDQKMIDLYISERPEIMVDYAKKERSIN